MQLQSRLLIDFQHALFSLCIKYRCCQSLLTMEVELRNKERSSMMWTPRTDPLNSSAVDGVRGVSSAGFPDVYCYLYIRKSKIWFTRVVLRPSPLSIVESQCGMMVLNTELKLIYNHYMRFSLLSRLLGYVTLCRLHPAQRSHGPLWVGNGAPTGSPGPLGPVLFCPVFGFAEEMYGHQWRCAWYQSTYITNISSCIERLLHRHPLTLPSWHQCT